MNNSQTIVFKETTRHSNNNIYLNANKKSYSPIKKELFLIQPIQQQHQINNGKENSFSHKRIKRIKQTSLHPIKDEIILDFDKILDIALSQPKLTKQKLRTLKKCINNKPKRSKLNNNKTHNKHITKKHNKQLYRYSSSYHHKTNSDLYDINNFFSNTVKIVEKKEYVKIECPKFREINDIELDDTIIQCENKDNNISDNKYLDYHNKCEKEEIDYRFKIYNESHLKKTFKKKMNCSITNNTNTNQSMLSENTDDNSITSTSNNLIIKIRIDND